jgi:hypothetical protein
LTRTNEAEVTGAKRGENKAVLVQIRFEPSEKGILFCKGEVLFLLIYPVKFTSVTVKFTPRALLNRVPFGCSTGVKSSKAI